jgi:hypothetical protein
MRGTQNGRTVQRLLKRAGAPAVTGPNGIFGQLAANGFAVFPANAVPPGGTSEALKAKKTGKQTWTAEMSPTGVWSERNPNEATVELARRATESFVDVAVRFIDRWKEHRPLQRP